MTKLVIVESPTKAKTISKFLGKNFTVESSFGHIRDLPSSSLGIDVEHDFEPKYVVPRKANAHVKKLKELVKKADHIVLATDEDREGEAIAWHLSQALGLGSSNFQDTNSKKIPKTKKGDAKKIVQRIVFHEITKKAIEEALGRPRELNMRMVDAQQARRILDRIVGYKLSPFLWKKIVRGLSAGRVQSVAVRLVVDREREIEKFKPQEYWTISAFLQNAQSPDPEDASPRIFEATLIKIDTTQLEKFGISSKNSADAIVADLSGASYTTLSVEKKAVRRMPPPPFTTSTLQQAASQRLGYQARQTMRIAQQLYETGLITYMRTDSLNLSIEALHAAKKYIESAFGSRYALPAPRTYKTKSKGAQEAHEAIRPTDITQTPSDPKTALDAPQKKLYELIWQRFTATQMPPAEFDAATADIAGRGAGKAYTFRATGSVLKFDGFLKVYPIKTVDTILPELARGDHLTLDRLEPKQHFTEPPPRFSEASLIKELEKNGIGRPSTYAPTIGTIQERNYAQKNDAKRFVPTEMGILVNDMLVEHFPSIVDIAFTATMEEQLDKIAAGEIAWKPAIREFYEPFEKNLQTKYETVEKKLTDEKTDETCDACGKPMIIKHGRFGKFIACSGFPDCRNTKRMPSETLGIACPACGKGEIVQKKTKRGKFFFGCSAYPACDFALWDKPTGDTCTTCGSLMTEKGKNIACSNKECGNASTKNS